ncbi:MAG: hypothetical protein IPN62_00280 [Flavobacteriales bacterium]|jgi:transcription elongation GreA/GreB family factor|nr:hypothetical protein [Flavobacteriales bacterium]
MEPTALKRAVLKAARTQLADIAAELKDRVADLRTVTVGDDDHETASQTESTRGGDVDLMNALSEQVEHVQQDLERIDALDPTVSCDTVQFGAVVHTDQRNFLIAASLEEFDAGGLRYLGVTPKAPVIQALLGKRVGEHATINGVAYHILAIH